MLLISGCCYFFKIQSEIVGVFMTFTRPVVQSSDHEEGMLCLAAAIVMSLFELIHSAFDHCNWCLKWTYNQ